SSVSLSGNTALIGAPYESVPAYHSGAAYVFDTISGQKLRKLLPSDGQMSDQFGESVALNNNTAFIGSGSGAYLFNVVTGQQRWKFARSGRNEVAVNDSFALVGDAGDNAAYVLDVTTGQQIAKLTPADGAPQNFGWSVALNGNLALIGALSHDGVGVDSGSAY